ncbi:hypothetical protein [Halococcus sp. IIIV-5B]|uniref:hypothetical protein n=1 Tax=Halococcus sp. IIIV-5B TaxID=2321230 RepID=UPI000E75528F|nr:hypothetical protein [Halococcus sp. IIIV-5B]RJT07133.1 hypothetical protein D3261_03755 [Halococcus sp. IIIV-5B]
MENDQRDAAITHLIDRIYRDARESYALAAYVEWAGAGGHPSDVFDPDGRGYVADGLCYLLTSALCARLAGHDDRGGNLAHQAQLVATDQRDHVRDHPVERAVFSEFVGDALVIADSEKAGSAYDEAAAAYEAAAPNDPVDWATQPPLAAATELLLHCSRNTSQAVEWDDLHGANPADEEYLAHRARYKKRVFPMVVESVLETGILHPPRGTTEHRSDDWQCPDCGTNEVNWTGGEVVCLDCSARMDSL